MLAQHKLSRESADRGEFSPKWCGQARTSRVGTTFSCPDPQH